MDALFIPAARLLATQGLAGLVIVGLSASVVVLWRRLQQEQAARVADLTVLVERYHGAAEESARTLEILCERVGP